MEPQASGDAVEKKSRVWRKTLLHCKPCGAIAGSPKLPPKKPASLPLLVWGGGWIGCRGQERCYSSLTDGLCSIGAGTGSAKSLESSFLGPSLDMGW